MSAGLLVLSAALLLWPGERSAQARVAGAGGESASLAQLMAATRCVPLPLMTGTAAASVAALLSTGLVAVVSGLCAGLAGRAWAGRRRATREQAALGSLAEALGALGAELRSGRPLEVAARVAAAAGADERCGRALVTAVCVPEETGGLAATPVDRALARISAAVRLSGRTGCSLAAVVGAVEDDLRGRVRQTEELRAATAGPRASASLLAGLPLVGLLMGSGVGADPWHVLTATGPGNALLVAGVGLEIAGITWSGRLVQRALR